MSIRKPSRLSESVDVVDFDNSVASRAVSAADDGGVIAGGKGGDHCAYDRCVVAGRKRPNDRALMRIVRRKAGRLDLSGLDRIVLPIVVRDKGVSVLVIQPEERVHQFSGDGDGWAKSAADDFLCAAAI